MQQAKHAQLRYLFFLLFFTLTIPFAKAQTKSARYNLSGVVKDASNGEVLVGATIYLVENKAAALSNTYGFYSVAAGLGKYKVRCTYMGYETIEKSIDLQTNQTLDFRLKPSESLLQSVEVTAKRSDENIRIPETSMVKLDAKTIAAIPALMGEVDILKVIQMLPGVQSTSEGSSGFSVRGGSPDQNLIILDEATVYNASHLIGFFSVFNNDAVKDVTLYKGDIPAAYGGRLSSLLDVRMKDGNSQTFAATGGIGTISSRLTLEGPIKNENTTFLLSGRRSYADLFLKLSSDEDMRKNKLYFYDLNGKLSHTFNPQNRLYASFYMGRDVFANDMARLEFGNMTASLRWSHLFSEKLFSNLSIIYSDYNYLVGATADFASFDWRSRMQDVSGRYDFTYYFNSNSILRFGASLIHHTFDWGEITLTQNDETSVFSAGRQYGLEPAVYAGIEEKFSPDFTLKAGLRFSGYQNMGPTTYYIYDENYDMVDSATVAKGKIYNSYWSFEPRISFVYTLNPVSSIKGAVSQTSQYVSLAQNSTAGNPLDIWFPVSPQIKPQRAQQYSLGYFRNFKDNLFESSLEVYYKHIENVIDFKDHATLLFNPRLEGEIRSGTGQAYGAEFLFRKNTGKLTGWISYTYSRAFRTIATINDGRQFSAPYDKPHNVNIILNYAVSKRIGVGTNWIYATGLPQTLPTGRAVVGNVIVPVYSDRNNYRMRDYHRLDLSVTLKNKEREGKRWKDELNFSIYNVYGRHNTWSINFKQNPDNPSEVFSEHTYLFGVIPSITYNFKF